ncbi:hypothetical protein ACLIYP_07800 [Streptomyces nanhaiensis]
MQAAPAETTVHTVLSLVTGDGAGEHWSVQVGREPEPFRFWSVPGQRHTCGLLSPRPGAPPHRSASSDRRPAPQSCLECWAARAP